MNHILLFFTFKSSNWDVLNSINKLKKWIIFRIYIMLILIWQDQRRSKVDQEHKGCVHKDQIWNNRLFQCKLYFLVFHGIFFLFRSLLQFVKFLWKIPILSYMYATIMTLFVLLAEKNLKLKTLKVKIKTPTKEEVLLFNKTEFHGDIHISNWIVVEFLALEGN